MDNNTELAIIVLAGALADAIETGTVPVTAELAEKWLAAARTVDPTDSTIAAHLRDTIRNNTDLTI